MKCSFSDTFLTSSEDMRDFIQHYVVAYLSHSDVHADFQFKGGTMLRTCSQRNYRYSEDLDFEVSRAAASESQIL